MRNPILVGERVYIRAVELSDSEALATIDATESETWMWRAQMPRSPLGYEKWITRLYGEWPPSNVLFAVCLREDDRLIGTVAVFGIDYVNRVGETGSLLGPAEVRGKGYGTEAKHLLLEFCFDHLHLHVLQSYVVETNTRSSAALAKQGYRHAGRLKWTDVKDGRYTDSNVYDLTRDEWLAAREATRQAAQASASFAPSTTPST
jgi:RimJ/RimL family protein N-acetyltransferase